MSDQAAAQARQMRDPRAASNAAAAQNIERRRGITQTAGVQIDRRRTEYTPETQVGDLSISRGRQVTEREEMGAGAQDRNRGAATRQQNLETQLNRARRREASPEKEQGGQGGQGGAPSLRDAMMLAKASPAGAVAGGALKAGAGQGLPIDEIRRGVGRGCIMSLWNSLWLTFGHTIYLISVLFFMSWASKFVRQYIPAVGEEWIPSPMLKKIPKAMLIPIKLAEIVGIAFILLFVFMLDVACLGLISLLLAVIMSAVNLVS